MVHHLLLRLSRSAISPKRRRSAISATSAMFRGAASPQIWESPTLFFFPPIRYPGRKGARHDLPRR